MLDFLKVNMRFLPLKFHYGLFNGGTSAVQLAMPLYAKLLRFSATTVGIIYTILPILGLIIKPGFGAIADKFKLHRAVMVGSVLIVTVSYFSVQFIPAPDLPAANIATRQYPVSALSACSSADQQPFFIAERGRCTWTCNMTPEFCSKLNLTSYCSSLYQVSDGESSCIPVSLSSQINLSKSDCKIHCLREVEAKADDDEDEDNFLSQEDTFSTWQFWIFLILLIGSWSGTAVSTTLTDTICIEMGGDQLYGRQRMWASLMWGLVGLINGFVVDAFSTEGEDKNYTPSFYLMLVPLAIDVVLTYFLEYDLKQQSESITKDAVKIMTKPKNMLFMLWCIVFGTSLGLQWNFLFWYFEDLADAYSPDVFSVVKTIEGLATAVQTIAGEAPALFFSGWIIKKCGYWHSMTLIFAILGLRFCLYALLVNPWWCLPIEILQNHYGLFYATLTSYAKSVSIPGTEATVQSVMCAFAEGIGVAIGSSVGGVFFDTYKGGNTFLIFGVFYLVVAVINEILQLLFKFVDNDGDQQPAITDSTIS